MSLKAAVGHALKIYPALKSCFSSEQDTLPRFVRSQNHFNNALLQIYLFYQSVLQVFIKFNLFLQRDDPLIARLHGLIQQFLRNLGCKFLTVTALAKSDPKEIEFENPRYQKAGKWLFLKMPKIDGFLETSLILLKDVITSLRGIKDVFYLLGLILNLNLLCNQYHCLLLYAFNKYHYYTTIYEVSILNSDMVRILVIFKYFFTVQ